MANFLNKNQNESGMSQRSLLEAKRNRSATNLLLVVLFTAINVVMLITGSNTYFLFSAFIPYALVDYGMYFCGRYPAEYYADMTDMVFANDSFLITMVVIAAIIIALYLISWIFAKKGKVGWLIFALVFFTIDTLAMFYFIGFATESIIDIIFHAWVIVSLVMGIVNHFNLKKLPEEEAVVEEIIEATENQTNEENV